MKTCSIDGCASGEHYARGWCNMHYSRWRRHGDPLAGGTWYTTPEDAFLARTEPLVWSDCIIWTGATNGDGYGSLSVNGRMVLAHRYAWERENGPIPEGMHVDHICHVRSCVSVDHLRPATRAQNNRNLQGPRRGRDLPRGVTRSGRGYAARVCVDRTRHYLGTFDTIAEASAAAATARSIHFGIFAGNN